MIYLDNAATSWPKPPCVAEEMVRFLGDVGANPGRSGHRLSVEAGRVVYGAREAVAALLGVADPTRIVFAANVTEALNLALVGLLRPGQHVVTSGMEHNAVMRPLRTLERQGVALTVVPCAPNGTLDPRALEAALRPDTALVVLNHASNVCGTLLPVAEVAAIARAHGVPLLVDAAQTAGAVPLDMEALGIDLLAFTGHKGLYGPTGTGGLCIAPRFDHTRIAPLVRGGTGSNSEREEQPAFLPDVFESGTPNAVGLAGLGAAVRWLLQTGVETVRRHEQALTSRLLDGLAALPGVTVYGPRDPVWQTATVALSIGGLDAGTAALRLDEEHGVLCRAGLHCAPAAHRTLGTYPQGTLRFSLGYLNTQQEVDRAIEAVARLAAEERA